MRTLFQCDNVQRWAHDVVYQRRCAAPAEPQFYEHVASCTICQGALLALAVAEPQIFPPLHAINCEACQADLAAWIDTERAEPSAGSAAFPAVWWHVLGCAACADDLALLLAMLAHDVVSQPVHTWQAAGWLPGPQPRAQQPLGTVILPRRMLTMSAQRFQRYQNEAVRGERTAQVLTRTTLAQHQVLVSLDPQPQHMWVLQLQVTPPLDGTVRAEVKGKSYKAALNPSGKAKLLAIPAADLFASAEPDIVLYIDQT